MKFARPPGVMFVVAGLTQAQQQSDPAIDGARQAAAAFTRSLPDYIVQRTTSRYRAGQISPAASALCNSQILGARVQCGTPEWQMLDVVQFPKQRSTALAGRSAWHYDYSIARPHLSRRLQIDASEYSPGYTGPIWIDKETSRVLRIDMSAHDIPGLPAHSQTVICRRTASVCRKNMIDFLDYKKYTAQAVINFDDKTN